MIHTLSFMTKRLYALEVDIVENMSGEKLIIPKEHCWVLGDNTEKSMDSRNYGAVPLTNLRSKCVGFYTTYPTRFRWFGDIQDVIEFGKAFWKETLSAW